MSFVDNKKNTEQEAVIGFKLHSWYVSRMGFTGNTPECSYIIPRWLAPLLTCSHTGCMTYISYF